MRYRITRKSAFRNIRWVYLTVWTCEKGELMFSIGNRQDWFRNNVAGHIIEGTHTSVCCYQSYDCPDKPLRKADARRAAIAYMTGYYKEIKVDLSDRS